MFLVRSGAIQGFERLVTELGVNPVDLLNEAGLSSAQLRNPNNYVSYSNLAGLLQLAAEACNEPLFGIMLSRRQTSSALGELAVYSFQQPSVQESLNSVNKYLYLHARGARLEQESHEKDTLLRLEINISSSLGEQQLLQMSIGQLCNFVCELMDLNHPTFPLLLRQHPPINNNGRVDNRFLGQVKFNSKTDGISIPTSWLKLKPKFDKQTLRDYLKAYVLKLQQQYPNRIEDQVKDIIGQLLPLSECNLDRVAKTLNIHPRILQERLQTIGTSYTQLLQQTRMEIAEQHLRYPSISITEIALQLGYAETSVFSSSFKRWSGRSPKQWQKHHHIS